MKINRAIFPIGLFQFISFLRRAVFYAFFYLYLRTFLGLPNTLAALLGTANLLGSTFGQLKIWGPRLNNDPFLARKYVVRGELIAAVTYLIAYYGHTIFLRLESDFGAAFFMIIVLSILEVFWSMSDLGVRFLVAQATEGQQRGQLVGFIDGLGLLGQIVGFLSSGILYRDSLGFSEGTIFYIVAFLIFLCAIVIQFSPQKRRTTFDDVPITSTGKLQELMRKPFYSFFLLYVVVVIIGISSSTQIFLYYCEGPLDFNDQLLSYLLILFSLTGGLITPLAGRASDKIGRTPVLMLGSFGASISYLLLFLLGEQPYLLIAIVFSLLGVCSSLLQSVSFAYTADLLPNRLRGPGFALFNIALATGWGLAGFMVGGPIADLIIFLGYPIAVAYRMSFLVSSVIILLGISLLFFYSRIMKQKQHILHDINHLQ